MQVKLIIILISFVVVRCNLQQNNAIYLLFEEGHAMTKETSPVSKEKYDYTFHIEKLSTKHSKYISSVIYEAVTLAKPLNVQRRKVDAKNIQWLRDQYVEAHNGFQNTPIGLGKDGRVLEFDLSKRGKKIFIIEQKGEQWFKTEAQRIY